jgi:hypothetical protein
MAYISKGLHRNVSKDAVRLMRRARDPNDKMDNLVHLWRRRKNPWLTVRNSDPMNTKEKFVRVRANDAWGSPFRKKEDFKNTDA